MENKRIYTISSIIAIAMMIPSCIWKYSVLDLFSGVGCSIIAASIMALYMERNNEKKKILKSEKMRNLYFKNINNELNMIFERIMWFDDRIDDPQFDWSRPAKEYSSFKYMIWASTNYGEGETLQFSEAEKRLKKIAEKYNLDRQREMTEEELIKVQKMFSIIACSGIHLYREAKTIEENKLHLNKENYLAIDKIDSLLFNISFAIELFALPNKNYSIAINELLGAARIVREVGQYIDDIHIRLHGSVSINEL